MLPGRFWLSLLVRWQRYVQRAGESTAPNATQLTAEDFKADCFEWKSNSRFAPISCPPFCGSSTHLVGTTTKGELHLHTTRRFLSRKRSDFLLSVCVSMRDLPYGIIESTLSCCQDESDAQRAMQRVNKHIPLIQYSKLIKIVRRGAPSGMLGGGAVPAIVFVRPHDGDHRESLYAGSCRQLGCREEEIVTGWQFLALINRCPKHRTADKKLPRTHDPQQQYHRRQLGKMCCCRRRLNVCDQTLVGLVNCAPTMMSVCSIRAFEREHVGQCKQGEPRPQLLQT